MNEKIAKLKVTLVMMVFFAIGFIAFGCYMAKFQDAVYLGFLSVVIGIIWFNWALYHKHVTLFGKGK